MSWSLGAETGQATSGRPLRLGTAQARLSASVRWWSSHGPRPVEPPADVLTERAKLLGLGTPGGVSANGHSRLLRCEDGWIAASLSRHSDVELIPALTGEVVELDPWKSLASAVAALPCAVVVERASYLGLAIAAVGEAQTAFQLPEPDQPVARWNRTPVALDLTALWAGPLCGGLLAEGGCRVIKAESSTRPDSTRHRSAAFDARLNGAKELWTFTPSSTPDMARLRGLIRRSDIVITSARERGLQSLGIAEALESAKGIWIAITAHDDPQRVGFGDDAAAAGGLVEWSDDRPTFVGDAIADPLTGLAAAATAFAALATARNGKYPLSLSSVARAALGWASE